MASFDLQLLSALQDDDGRNAQRSEPDPNEQKDYISSNIQDLTRAEIISVFRIVYLGGQKDLFRSSGEDLIINLNKVNDELIYKMYALMSIILAKKKSAAQI